VPGKRLRGALIRAAKAARNRFIVETVRAGGPPLAPLEPGGRFGAGLDERSVEMPLAIAVAALDRPGLVLDAGAALNLPLVRQVAPAPAAQLTHFTLPGSNEPRLPDADGHFEYAFGDLRMMPYPDATFDRVVCVSTLEHVGMDTTRFGAAPSGAGDASRAVAELVRVLAPGGTLFLTVPYGRAADHGWFRVLDRAGLHSLLQPVAAHQVALRFFYYEQGWVEGREEPPARVVDSQFDSDVVCGVAIAHVIKQ
jgi:SAM-dependent methyltransferase